LVSSASFFCKSASCSCCAFNSAPCVGLEPLDFLAQRGDLGIGGGGFRRGLLRSRLEEELTCELCAFNRLLLVVWFLPYVVAYLDHHVADALAFLADMAE
jgi:hypothetical protein